MIPFLDAPYLKGFEHKATADAIATAVHSWAPSQDVWVEPYKSGWAVRFGDCRVLRVCADDGGEDE